MRNSKSERKVLKEEDMTLKTLSGHPLFIFFATSTCLTMLSAFTTTFWLSSVSFPSGFNLAFEIFLEIWFFVDFLVRWVLATLDTYNLQNLFVRNFKEKKMVRLTLLLSSLPYVFSVRFAYSYDSGNFQIENGYYTFLMIPKLFRLQEMKQFIDRFQQILIFSNFKYIFTFKLIENGLILASLSHLTACAWLLVNKLQGDNVGFLCNSVGFWKGFFARNPSSSLLDMYIDSLGWGVITMIGAAMGDVTPRTTYEIVLSIITMLVGAIFYAKIFAEFEKITFIRAKERMEKAQNFVLCKQFCVAKKIPVDLKRKIKMFYTGEIKGEVEAKNYSSFFELPSSLHTEISLYVHESLIKKVKLFKLGSPSFILAVAKSLVPSVCLANDTVIRAGEIAESFYFIREGTVEVLCSDGKTRIGVLDAGAYFGEVGILLTSIRSVNIKAVTNCVFGIISKDKFLKILSLFPQQEEMLKKVARQRLQTTHPEDLDIDAKSEHENSEHENANAKMSMKKGTIAKFSKKKRLQTRKGNESFDLGNNSIRRISEAFNDGLAQIIENVKIHSKFTVIPLSRFYKIWTYLLALTSLYYIIYFPFSLCFNFQFEGKRIWFDVIPTLVFCADIFIHWRTAEKKGKQYILDEDLSIHKLTSGEVFLDILAFIPLDVAIAAAGGLPIYSASARILKMLKLFRLKTLYFEIRDNTEKKSPYTRLAFYCLLNVLLSHYWACVMYAVAYMEFESFEGNTMVSFIYSDKTT